MATETITLTDGSKYRVPAGLSDEQALNLIAKATPEKMIESGIAYDIEKEYNIRDGVQDFDARFGAAIARGNPKEIKEVFDNSFGKGNWGLSDFNNEPYVTPEGLRNVGIEPTDNRKVLMDGMGLDFYDLVADPFPELAVAGASIAAELAVPLPGTSAAGGAVMRGLLSRGLMARSARAGLGASIGSMGVEGVQQLRGEQRESVGEQLQRAGTEGLLVGVGSLVLGAPFSAMGTVANRVKQTAKDLPTSQQNVSTVSIDAMKQAQARVAEKVGEEDALLLSLRTLVGEEGLVFGNMLSKIEGIGAKQLGDSYSKRVIEFMDKYRRVAVESARQGDSELTTLAKLKSKLNTQEQKFARDIVKSLSTFNKSSFGKLDKAASTLRDMKDFQNEKLAAQYKRGMNAFDGPEYYGNSAFVGLDNAVLKPDQLADFLQNVSFKSGVSVDDLLYGVFQPLAGQIRSRVKIDPDTGVIKPIKRKTKKDVLSDPLHPFNVPSSALDSDFVNFLQQKFKVDKPKAVEKFVKGRGSQVTLGDFFKLDQALRKTAYAQRKNNLNAVKEKLDISTALQQEIARLSPGQFKKQLDKATSAYSRFANIYRGKTGLFEQISQRPEPDAYNYLKNFVSGKEGREFSEVLNKLEQAFGPDAIGQKAEAVKLGLQTRDEILSSIGLNFIRESKDTIQGALNLDLQAKTKNLVRFKKAAKKELENLNQIETILKQRLGTNQQAKKAITSLFGKDTVKEYKNILKQISTGTPDQAARASQKLNVIMSFSEAEKFIGVLENAAGKLSGANLDDLVAQFKAFEQLDKGSAEFAKDLMFSENWGRVLTAGNLSKPEARLEGLRSWADDWVLASSSNRENMKYLFGDVFEPMDDLALNIRGSLNIDPVAGALSVPEQQVSILRNFLRMSASGVMKPLSFVFATKQMAPGSPLWTRVNNAISAGKSVDKVIKENGPMVTKVMSRAQSSAETVQSGKNGLLAASVASYMEEANQTYPVEGEVPTVPVQKAPVSQPEPQPQQVSQVSPQMGIDAIRQIASMIEGTGTGGIEEGASIARSAA